MAPIRADRRALRQAASEVRYAGCLRALPPRVALFHWRAHRVALRIGDEFSLISATRPPDLRVLLKLARHRRRVVELGTGTAWTTLALAIDDRRREVISFDPCVRPQKEHYLRLVDAEVRNRVTFVAAPGAAGPQDPHPIELLYVDSSHAREDTINELRAWRPALPAGALVVLDDYNHSEFPGVRQAVEELGLDGVQDGTLFVHEVQATERPRC